jgi:hypothetical protein
MDWTGEGIFWPIILDKTARGFKNSPTLFDEALSQDLIVLRAEHQGVVLLQYVDDLLSAAENETDCKEATKDLLKDLGDEIPRWWLEGGSRKRAS